MLICQVTDPDMSEDSDEDRDTKHNLLDVDDCGHEMIEEEDEGAECDECCHRHHAHNCEGGCEESSEELPFIKDVDRNKFKTIYPGQNQTLQTNITPEQNEQ